MQSLEQFSQRLRQSLDGFLEEPKVSAIAGDRYRVLGIIVSPTFEGMDEGERQEIVWNRVLTTFDDNEQNQIEFLFTDAPSEVGS